MRLLASVPRSPPAPPLFNVGNKMLFAGCTWNDLGSATARALERTAFNIEEGGAGDTDAHGVLSSERAQVNLPLETLRPRPKLSTPFSKFAPNLSLLRARVGRNRTASVASCATPEVLQKHSPRTVPVQSPHSPRNSPRCEKTQSPYFLFY